MICSTHGPVWEEKIPQVIDMYDKMSRYEGEEGVVIVYGTMYGNTEELAETIAEELSAQGIKNYCNAQCFRKLIIHLSWQISLNIKV